MKFFSGENGGKPPTLWDPRSQRSHASQATSRAEMIHEKVGVKKFHQHEKGQISAIGNIRNIVEKPWKFSDLQICHLDNFSGAEGFDKDLGMFQR